MLNYIFFARRDKRVVKIALQNCSITLIGRGGGRTPQHPPSGYALSWTLVKTKINNGIFAKHDNLFIILFYLLVIFGTVLILQQFANNAGYC